MITIHPSARRKEDKETGEEARREITEQRKSSNTREEKVEDGIAEGAESIADEVGTSSGPWSIHMAAATNSHRDGPSPDEYSRSRQQDDDDNAADDVPFA